jgi:hypothetical protein
VHVDVRVSVTLVVWGSVFRFSCSEISGASLYQPMHFINHFFDCARRCYPGSVM